MTFLPFFFPPQNAFLMIPSNFPPLKVFPSSPPFYRKFEQSGPTFPFLSPFATLNMASFDRPPLPLFLKDFLP